MSHVEAEASRTGEVMRQEKRQRGAKEAAKTVAGRIPQVNTTSEDNKRACERVSHVDGGLQL